MQVYAGANKTFDLVEDDGTTLDYKTSMDTATKTTSFSWNDALKSLSWTTAGAFSDPKNLFSSVRAVLFEAGAVAPRYSEVQKLGPTGEIKFSIKF